MFAYHGRYLRVDLSAGASECVPLRESELRTMLGGVGLGTLLLARETPSGVDPLGAESALIFAFSPLVGSPLTTSAKFAVVAFSPLTGRVCDALSSSHFALAGKRAGVDAIVIKGRAPARSIIQIDGIGLEEPIARVLSAEDLWGESAANAELQLRSKWGADWQIAAIGRAGELQVPFATISHDGRHAGRGGLGAVLGAKQIKAIAVRGDQRAPIANPERTVALARDLSARSFGPATEKYRELGTVANLLVFNRFDALPTRNFQRGRFAEVEQLATQDLGPARKVARHSCACCTIGCEHIYKVNGDQGVRLEYESLFALGPLCGISDPEIVLQAARRCDELGIDTITTGGTIAFLMEAIEQGLIPSEFTKGEPVLEFGSGSALLALIDALPSRAGLARLLALGSRGAAERLGGKAVNFAMHVKGLELPGYDPRSLQTMALGLAVGTRGADHNRSGAYEADFSERANRLRGGVDSARLAMETEDRAALIDSLILCKFLRGVFDELYAESAELLEAVTGWTVAADELRLVARRVVNARKLLNLREGWTRAEDTLPPRLLSDEPSEPGAPFLPAARLDEMIAAYYESRGWDADGRVPITLRRELGLAGRDFGP